MRYELIQIQNIISQLIFEILERFFQLSTSLKYFYQKRYKNLELKDVSKCGEKIKFVLMNHSSSCSFDTKTYVYLRP